MLILATFLLSTIFFILSIIHFNWAIGGMWGYNNALPTNEEGKRMLNPKKIDSAIVGLTLFSFAGFFLVYGNLISISIPAWLHQYGAWGISTLFLLRAIGEFRYVGFFKKVTTTEFARLDSKYYSPLCLFLAVLGLVSTFFK